MNILTFCLSIRIEYLLTDISDFKQTFDKPLLYMKKLIRSD